MLKQLSDRISDTNSVCSIEIQLEADGTMLLNWVLLSKKKQVLVLENSGTAKGDLNVILDFVAPTVPLVLSLSGKGVLHKKVEQQGGNTGKLFDYIFPNARISDYLIQTVLCQDNSFQVSVVRKEQVDKLLTGLSELGFYVLSLSFGPFSVLPLFKLLNINVKEVQLGRHVLQLDYHTPSVYSYTIQASNSHLISIANEQLADHLVVPYAMAFQYLVGGERVEVEYESIQVLAQTHKDKKLFKVLSWGSLVFFFSLLLINTLFYTIVSGENNDLSTAYSGLEHASLSTKKNVEEFNQKETFLMKAGWLDASVMSYYADRIAASLPQAIQLTSINVCPVNEALTRKEKKEVFDQGIIVVKGIASRPTELNQWTKVLDQYTWIEQVKVQDYTFDHKTGRGNFTLHLNTSGELE